jgi:hypothetical protein
MSDRTLRTDLVRLAHSHPEFRKDLLPIIKACDPMGPEAPMLGKFEEGKPADPTENMTEEQKKQWWAEHEKNKDQFKGAAGSVDPRYQTSSKEASTMSDTQLRAGLIRLAHTHPEFRKDLLPLIKEAGCEKLPEGGMRENCEKKKEEGGEKKEDGDKGKEAASKTAGMAVVRRMIAIAVRIIRHQAKPEGLVVFGQMSIDFGGGTPPDAVRFGAAVRQEGDRYVVVSFQPQRSVSGGGADIILNVLRGALQEAFDSKGAQLLGTAAADLVPEPMVMS